MAKTYLDELVEYPVKALHKIGTDPAVVQLLTDNPEIDMSSEDADSVFDKYLYDYGYVDSTITQTSAYICVEAEVDKIPNATIQNMRIFVTIFCHKEFMNINTSRFKGMIGNRRDNLVRYIDKLLNGTSIFGIGKLTLEAVRTIPSPTGFSAREMTYVVPDFRTKDPK